MTDLQKAYEIFDDYSLKYDMSDRDMNYKFHHSKRVAQNCRMLKNDDASELIGLFHDIARYDQKQKVKNFRDIGYDHGDEGVKIAKELLTGLELFDKNEATILTAIKYHNKYKVPETLSPEEAEYTNVIRDADIIDILDFFSKKNTRSFDYSSPASAIRKEHEETFFQGKTINKSKGTNRSEDLLAAIALIFAMNHPELAKESLIKSKKYLLPEYHKYVDFAVEKTK